MTRTIDVIIPTLRRDHAWAAIESLRFVPWGIRLHVVSEGRTWAEAVNLGLRRTTHDVLLMDDDVEILPETFTTLDAHYGDADAFGFKLRFPDGRLQHAGGVVRSGRIAHIGHGRSDVHRSEMPYYVCHATTSLYYLKRATVDAVGEMAEDYPGYQFEDVDYNFRLLKAGYDILYLPSPAIHRESATKSTLPGFGTGMAQAYAEVVKRHLYDPAFLALVESYPRMEARARSLSSV